MLVGVDLRQHDVGLLLGILGLALAVRMAFAVLFVGLDAPPTYDGIAYDTFAVQIAQGEGYHTELGPSALKAPLYPYFLGGLYALVGPSNHTGIRVVQALLDSLSCVFVCFLGTALAGRWVGLLSALGAAVYPLSIYMSAQIYPETLFLLLVTAMLFVAVKMVREGRGRFAMICGCLSGLCVLTRPNSALLVPVVMAYPLFTQTRKPGWRLPVVFLLAAILTIVPWTIRNYLAFQEVVPLTTEAGGVFWSGNNPFAEGGSVIPTKETWLGDDYPDRLWDGWSGLGEAESSRRFFRTAVDWIVAHPSDFLALVPKKLARLWSPVSFTTQSDRRADPLTKLLWLPFLIFLLLVAWGFVASLKNWRLWWIVYGLIIAANLTVAVFHGGTRFSVPMMPALLLFAATGMLGLLTKAAALRRGVGS